GRAAELGGGVLGRFGWKAQIPSVDEFVRDALTAELGMSLEPSAGLSFGFLQDDDGLADPEFGLEGEQILADFLRELAPPPRQPPGDAAAAARGEQLFATVGCATCHVPALPGSFGPVALYSDLLLHDVLAEDARGVEEGVATTREFRTAPLWGISRTAPYLHDGSADTLEQAILGHHAEAARSRADFEVLSEREQADLLEFLSTL
ncbi:MAG: di-heme oxidoredictase family protein, partial [Myxococcota bacterium]